MANKIFFIDSNAFIGCATQEAKGLDLDVLEKIEKNLNNKKMILLLPSVIKQEILMEHARKFEELLDLIAKNFLKQFPGDKGNILINDILIKSKKDAREIILKKQKETILLIKTIFRNKQTKKIPLVDKDIISGMKRACLQIPPYTKKQERKSTYERDIDCIAYESILNYLTKFGNSKKDEIIFCTNDKDYIVKKPKKIELHPVLKRELQKKCKLVSVYNNPLNMLNKEFKVGYKPKQIKEYEEKIVTQAVPPQWDPTNVKNQGVFYAGNTATILNADHMYPSGQLNAADLSTGTVSFDPTSQPASTPQANDFVSRKTTHCPNCSIDIKQEIDNFFSDGIMSFVSPFICPSCHKQFSIGYY